MVILKHIGPLKPSSTVMLLLHHWGHISPNIVVKFTDKSFVEDLQYGIRAKERVRLSLENTEREWWDVMDGDLYRDLLKPSGFLTNDNNLSLLFNTDGVHVFKASRDEIWPLGGCE